MTDLELGDKYFEEAKKIEIKINKIKKIKNKSNDDEKRLRILTDMYFDCIFTGKILKRKDE